MPRRSEPRTLAVWLAALVAVVALASAALTAGALARALGATNRAQAAAALVAEAETLTALAEQGSMLRLAARIRVVNARAGWSAQVVGGGLASREPFDAVDVTGVPESEPVERSVDGASWLVLARPVSTASSADQGTTVLLARRLAQASRLTPDQRRSLVVAALAGLVAGAGAALLVAGRISAPLRRLSAAAGALARGSAISTSRTRGPPRWSTWPPPWRRSPGTWTSRSAAADPSCSPSRTNCGPR